MENKSEQTKSNRVIKLQDLVKRGVHIEKITEMENSLYQGIYERAFESVGKIVEFNRTYTDNFSSAFCSLAVNPEKLSVNDICW